MLLSVLSYSDLKVELNLEGERLRAVSVTTSNNIASVPRPTPERVGGCLVSKSKSTALQSFIALPYVSHTWSNSMGVEANEILTVAEYSSDKPSLAPVG